MPFYLYVVSNVEEPVKCPDRVTGSVLSLQYYRKEIPRKYNTNSKQQYYTAAPLIKKNKETNKKPSGFKFWEFKWTHNVELSSYY